MTKEEALETILSFGDYDYWKYTILKECVEVIKDDFEIMEQNHETVLTTLESATNEIAELNKVLNIIKNKGILPNYLEISTNYEMYNLLLPANMQVTQYEFELLKRWLCNDLD